MVPRSCTASASKRILYHVPCHGLRFSVVSHATWYCSRARSRSRPFHIAVHEAAPAAVSVILAFAIKIQSLFICLPDYLDLLLATHSSLFVKKVMVEEREVDLA